MRFLLASLFIILLLPSQVCFSQGCCAGGSGSPIAGGASQGVLLERQMEIASSFQYIYTDKFLVRDKDTLAFFDHFSSRYIYSKIGYGITKNFTFSAELGYFLNKTQLGLRDSITQIPIDTFTSSGIADLILFPRYDIINITEERRRVELTLGMGWKIPLGKFNDSTVVFHNPFTGKDIYAMMPPLVQPTTGSQDFILYTFFCRVFPTINFRVFTNAFYIRKGWNPLGFKYGDYASAGIFAGKTFFEKLGVTLQLKGEWLDSMRHVKDIDMVALYSIYVGHTGGKKIFFVPQLSYTFKNLTFFALSEIPLYEYVNGTQPAAHRNITSGISYRFFPRRSKVPDMPGE